MVRLKYLAGINERSLSEQTEPEQEMEYIDISSVGRNGLQAKPEVMRFKNAPSRARRLVGKGDTVVSTVRTYLRAVWAASGDLDRIVVSTGFAVLSPKNIDPGFFSWWVRSDAFIEEVVARSTGVSYPAIGAPELGELLVRVPPQEEQRAIADYLDTETARIDAVIEKKKRMMELLEDRFWLNVVEAISQLEAPMTQLRRMITRISDGPFGSSLTSAHYKDAGARVVRLGNIRFASFNNSDEAFISTDHFASLGRHRVWEGDLLIAGLGDTRNHVGRACVAPDLGDAIVKADCYCAGVDPAVAIPDFLALFLSSPAGAAQVAIAARGTTRSRINLDIAKEINVPFLPLSEQRRIVDMANQDRLATTQAAGGLSRQIELLAEKRQALITAAVTGELEIHGVAA